MGDGGGRRERAKLRNFQRRVIRDIDRRRVLHHFRDDWRYFNAALKKIIVPEMTFSSTRKHFPCTLSASIFNGQIVLLVGAIGARAHVHTRVIERNDLNSAL